MSLAKANGRYKACVISNFSLIPVWSKVLKMSIYCLQNLSVGLFQGINCTNITDSLAGKGLNRSLTFVSDN